MALSGTLSALFSHCHARGAGRRAPASQGTQDSAQGAAPHARARLGAPGRIVQTPRRPASVGPTYPPNIALMAFILTGLARRARSVFPSIHSYNCSPSRRFRQTPEQKLLPYSAFQTQNALSLQPAGGFAPKSERALYILIHCYSAHFMLP
jgi:hypothetical protein